MNFTCKVKIVDSVMGSGKSQAAIHYINNSNEYEKFIYITPLLTEVDRIITSCPTKNFYQPQPYKTGKKIDGLKQLLQQGRNIVATHALFKMFDQEVIDICRVHDYTLIMDEVTEVIEPYHVTNADFKNLIENYVYIDENTSLIKWREDKCDYKGKFDLEKRYCDFNCLAYYGGEIMMWLFPIEVFNAFKNIIILTYMFESQMQRYYYDFYKLPYSYMYVAGNDVDNYYFTDIYTPSVSKYDYSKLIHICDHKKLNMIGEGDYDLSLSWYKRNENNIVMKQLQKNVYNYFKNVRKTPSSLNLWTTFNDYEKKLKGKGYGKAFLYHTARATNDYRTRISVAYLVNKFLNTLIKQFFVQNDVSIDEDGYALSEMLQFIWRSAIRDGKEIWIYIPSKRMRNLLTEWIESNSK